MKQRCLRGLACLLALLMLTGVALFAVSCNKGDDGGNKFPVRPDPKPDPDPDPGPTDEPIAEGTIDGISWEISAAGDMEMWGSGEIPDFSRTEHPEWSAYADSVKTLYIGGGVTRIGAYAFSDLTGMWSAELPAGTEEIAPHAFEGCVGLITLSLGGGSPRIGDAAFLGCYKLVELVGADGLSVSPGSPSDGLIAYYALNTEATYSAVFPHDDDPDFLFYTTDAGDALVGYIGGASDVTLPAGNYSVYPYALCGNDRLTAVSTGDAREIGAYAFSGCTSLRQVTVEGRVTAIADSAFRDCTSLWEVTVDAAPETVGSHVFAGCTSLIRADISGLTDVPAYAFLDCTALREVTLGTVGTIGDGAFSGCTDLMAAELPAGVTGIGAYAFSGSGIKTAVLPDSVTAIGDHAFDGCWGLYSVTLGAGVREIGAESFRDCGALLEVINRSALPVEAGRLTCGKVAARAVSVTRGNSAVQLQDGFAYLVGADRSYLLGYTGAETILTLPRTLGGKTYEVVAGAFRNTRYCVMDMRNAGILAIGYRAFAGSAVREAWIPGTVKRVGAEAFFASDIQTVTLGEGVEEIAAGAFRACKSLQLVRYDGTPTLRTVGKYAFYESGLVQFIVPRSMYGDSEGGGNANAFGTDAFFGCTRLIEVVNLTQFSIRTGSSGYGGVAAHARQVTSSEALSKIREQDGFLFYDAYTAVYLVGYVGAAQDLILPRETPGGKTEYVIPDYAFSGRRDIRSVAIVAEASVGGDAFSHCENLKLVYIGEDVVKVGAFAFDECHPQLSVMTGQFRVPYAWDAEWNCARSSYELLKDNKHLSYLERRADAYYTVNFEVEEADYLRLIGIRDPDAAN